MTHIWVPKVKVLEAELPSSKARVKGFYTLKRRKADTGDLIQQVGPFENLITDVGLDRMGVNAYAPYGFVGTGTATPAITDTQMGSFVHGTTSAVPGGTWNAAAIRGGAPDYWVQSEVTFNFTPGQATGNLTEVGVGWNSGGVLNTGHRVFSRALIVDGGGNPVTLTILADEYLELTYSLRMYPPLLTDSTQIVDISGTSHTFVTRALRITSTPRINNNVVHYAGNEFTLYTGTAAGTPPSLSPITGNTLTNQGAYSYLAGTLSTYVPGSYTAGVTLTASPSQGNLAYGIRGCAAHVGVSGSRGLTFGLQSTITPAIPKDNTKTLSFGQQFSWARH
ncbi:MAG: hypothetical protein ACK5LJ_09820 [Paracoccus sp. (in: a-proteobacteria)]